MYKEMHMKMLLENKLFTDLTETVAINVWNLSLKW